MVQSARCEMGVDAIIDYYAYPRGVDAIFDSAGFDKIFDSDDIGKLPQHYSITTQDGLAISSSILGLDGEVFTFPGRGRAAELERLWVKLMARA